MSKNFKNKPYKQEESNYNYQDRILDCAIEETIEKEESSIEYERRIRIHKQKMFMYLGNEINCIAIVKTSLKRAFMHQA